MVRKTFGTVDVLRGNQLPGPGLRGPASFKGQLFLEEGSGNYYKAKEAGAEVEYERVVIAPPSNPLDTPEGLELIAEAVTEIGDTRYAGVRDHEISAKEFGVKGDGTDETAKLQAFVDYVVNNGAHGVIPFREVRISQAISVPSNRGWMIRGMGHWRGTNIIQTTNNIPIFRMGVGNGSLFRDWALRDICLTYLNPQAATNTSANCLYFESMAYQFQIDNVYLRNGYYGVGYVNGMGGAWGGDWDRLIFGGMSGGWINMAGTINSVPNNRFGRIYGDSSQCTDFLFKSFTGYNSTISTVEVINHANGAGVVGSGVFDFTTNSSFIIGAFKLEGGKFAGSSPDIVRIAAGAYIQFGEFRLQASNGGLIVAPSSGDCSVFAMNLGGTSVSTVEIGLLAVTATAGAVNAYLFRGGQRFSQVFIRRLDKTIWKMTNRSGGQLISENIRIDQWMNRRLSANKGDAAVVIVPGETEQTIFFETPLTAPRNVDLPIDSSDLIGGLTYRIYIANGVVNGTNYLRIRFPGIVVKYEKQSTTGEIITFEWRTTVAGHNGWYITSQTPIN